MTQISSEATFKTAYVALIKNNSFFFTIAHKPHYVFQKKANKL